MSAFTTRYITREEAIEKVKEMKLPRVIRKLEAKINLLSNSELQGKCDILGEDSLENYIVKEG